MSAAIRQRCRTRSHVKLDYDRSSGAAEVEDSPELQHHDGVWWRELFGHGFVKRRRRGGATGGGKEGNKQLGEGAPTPQYIGGGGQ